MAAFLFCLLFVSVAAVRTADRSKINQPSEHFDDRIRAVVSEMLAEQAYMYDRRIVELEHQQLWQSRRIKTLETKVKRQEKNIRDLTMKVYALNHNEDVPKGYAADPRKKMLDNGIVQPHEIINKNKKFKTTNKVNSSMRTSSVDNVRTRAIEVSENIAFTAYLDHDINHMADGHTVKFNQIHLNDGNGYNAHTGIFTVPVSGVYLFTYHWNSHYRMTILELMVDDGQKAAAISSPYANHEAMGAQTVIIRVNAGQSVWVEDKITGDGEMFIGGPARYATFAGILLY